MQHAIVAGLTPCITMLVMAIFAAYAIRPARVDTLTGDLVLQYSGLLRGMLWVGCLGATGLGLTLICAVPDQPLRIPAEDARLWRLSVGSILAIACGLPLGLFALVARSMRIYLNDDGVTYESALCLPHLIAWGDIERITYNSSMEWFVIRSRTGETIRVSAWISGVLEFRDQIKARLPQAVYEQARSGFGKIGTNAFL